MFWRKKQPPPACPRCAKALSRELVTTAAENWEVEVDVCRPGCGGLWLDDHDFSADAHADLLLNQQLLLLNAPGKTATRPPGAAKCPACAVPFQRWDWHKTGIILDRCKQCKGLWFDGGELRQVQQHIGRVRHLKGL